MQPVEDSKRTYLIDDPAVKKQVVYHNFHSVPHTTKLGMEFVFAEHHRAGAKLPYREDLVGNTGNGAIHTGVLLSLIDGVSGLSVICSLPKFESIATLDMRLDCYKPSTAGLDLFAEAECFKLTSTIAFVRGTIYHESPDDPIAGCIATFFRSGSIPKRSGPKQEKGV